MSKKISECDNNWTNTPTMFIADKLYVDDFIPMVNKCSTVDEFNTGAKEIIMNKIGSCKSYIDDICLDPNNDLKLLAISALDNVDVEKILQVVTSCFQQEILLYQLENRVRNIVKELKYCRYNKIVDLIRY